MVELAGDVYIIGMKLVGKLFQARYELVMIQVDHVPGAAVFINDASPDNYQGYASAGSFFIETQEPIAYLPVRGIVEMHCRHDNSIFQAHAPDIYGCEQFFQKFSPNGSI